MWTFPSGTVKQRRATGAWRLLVFCILQLKVIAIFKKKSRIIEHTIIADLGPGYLQMKSKNEMLACTIKHNDWESILWWECTACETLQRHSPVEIGFRILSIVSPSMMKKANVPKDAWKFPMPEVARSQR
jgi:hypothetical protein